MATSLPTRGGGVGGRGLKRPGSVSWHQQGPLARTEPTTPLPLPRALEASPGENVHTYKAHPGRQVGPDQRQPSPWKRSQRQ